MKRPIDVPFRSRRLGRDEVEKLDGALDPVLGAQVSDDPEPLGGELSGNFGIADSGRPNAQAAGQPSTADGFADFRDGDHGGMVSPSFVDLQGPFRSQSIKNGNLYKGGMQVTEKERIARKGDMGLVACAIRLRAARHLTGLSQTEACLQIGLKKTTYNNMEQGKSYPSREVMRWYYRAHRVDFNFMMNGDFAQLPTDVNDRLFDALEAATREWDRRPS